MRSYWESGAAEGDEVVEGDDLRRDEAALEIAVDDSGGGGFVFAADGRGAGDLWVFGINRFAGG